MIAHEIKKFFKGEIAYDRETIEKYSRDASLFQIVPELVVFPKDADDIKGLVNFVRNNKKHFKNLSLTARSGGTDMTGGPLNESIIVDLTKYFNRVKEIGEGFAVVAPGVFYRDFEKKTLKKNLLLPTYPASREICTVGGMVANNAGGEKTLRYGKTIDYVMELKVVLSDGKEYILKPLDKKELNEKLNLQNFEGEVYREVYNLIKKNAKLIQGAKPRVSKNSAGFNLWDVWDPLRETSLSDGADGKKGVFDLTKLFVGSQGTLGIITEVKFRLIPVKKYSGLLVVFMKDLNDLPEVIKRTLELGPTSFESFDDHTFKLALKFFTGFLKVMGKRNILSLAFQFLPEFSRVLVGGTPKMTLLVEFEEESQQAVNRKIGELKRALESFKLFTRSAPTREKSKKYWAMRRESFNLLRQKVKGFDAAPFVDDIIVRPEYLPEFLPKLYEILDRYKLLYTIAGHIGDGNFHIIPLMRLADEVEIKKIPKATREVYGLVIEFGGSITAEHNDGLIRTPFLEDMYGKEVYGLFEKVKNIFDPQNIFNPRKKVGGDLNYALSRIRELWVRNV